MRRPPIAVLFRQINKFGETLSLSHLALSSPAANFSRARRERERSLDFANENESPLPSSQHSVRRSPLRLRPPSIGEINAKAADTADTAAAAVWISNARRTVSASPVRHRFGSPIGKVEVYQTGCYLSASKWMEPNLGEFEF